MTAYLQPGDKIHLDLPYQGSIEADDEKACQLREDYKSRGVEVFLFTVCATGSPLRIVSVIRPEPQFADWLAPSSD